MNANTNQEKDEQDTLINYDDIHKSFKNKSSFRPNPPNKTPDTFKRAFKMNLLKCKVDHNSYNNLTKQQFKGLKELRENTEIVIKRQIKDLR